MIVKDRERELAQLLVKALPKGRRDAFVDGWRVRRSESGKTLIASVRAGSGGVRLQAGDVLELSAMMARWEGA